MDKNVAKTLLAELSRHPEVFTVDSTLILERLEASRVEESSKFYEEISGAVQTFNEADAMHELNIRKILRNRNARGYRANAVKRGVMAIVSSLGVYSSSGLTRSLRAEREIVEMMGDSREPFSLLGKLSTVYFENPENMTRVTRPILVIPGARNLEAIYAWERRNTKDGKAGKECYV